MTEGRSLGFILRIAVQICVFAIVVLQLAACWSSDFILVTFFPLAEGPFAIAFVWAVLNAALIAPLIAVGFVFAARVGHCRAFQLARLARYLAIGFVVSVILAGAIGLVVQLLAKGGIQLATVYPPSSPDFLGAAAFVEASFVLGVLTCMALIGGALFCRISQDRPSGRELHSERTHTDGSP